jgi:hypothetical protein
MPLQKFKDSLANDSAPTDVSPHLQAMWYERKGDWDAAHRLIQDQPDADGAWVHAYLHRQEGDQPNAAYWYRRAGKPVSNKSLEAEWEEIVAALLAK